MRSHKQISYGLSGHTKTSMHVLHDALGQMQLSGFHRERTSIFEEACMGRIEFSTINPKKTPWLVSKTPESKLEAGNDNAQVAFTLDIYVVEHNDDVGTFSIYSEITPNTPKKRQFKLGG